MSHFAYVMTSYLVSAIVLLGLIIWILADQHIQKKELLRLEKLGVRRRSQQAQQGQHSQKNRGSPKALGSLKEK